MSAFRWVHVQGFVGLIKEPFLLSVQQVQFVFQEVSGSSVVEVIITERIVEEELILASTMSFYFCNECLETSDIQNGQSVVHVDVGVS